MDALTLFLFETLLHHEVIIRPVVEIIAAYGVLWMAKEHIIQHRYVEKSDGHVLIKAFKKDILYKRRGEP